MSLGKPLRHSQFTLNNRRQSPNIILFQNEYGEIDSRTQIVDSVQTAFGCCGATGPGDWAGSKYSRKNGYLDQLSDKSLRVGVSDPENFYDIPASCCKIKNMDDCNRARRVKFADVVGPDIYNTVSAPPPPP